MKNLKQLVLPCYKLEMAMSVEAWYFLHGSTDGYIFHKVNFFDFHIKSFLQIPMQIFFFQFPHFQKTYNYAIYFL